MIDTTRIACYGHRHLALDAARELFEEMGFSTAEVDDDRVRFVNPRRRNVANPSSVSFADAVEVSLRPDQVVLAADLSGVGRRTLVLGWAVGFVGVLLLVANWLWAEPMQPPLKALLPISPWPFLLPLIHKNMTWNARRRYGDILREIGRHAAVMAARNAVETADAETPAPPTDKADEPETVEV